MIDTENAEWFEFVNEGNNLAVKQLNDLAKTHYIIQTHYAVASSSDWNMMSGGYSYILVEAVKKEEIND